MRYEVFKDFAMPKLLNTHYLQLTIYFLGLNLNNLQNL